MQIPVKSNYWETYKNKTNRESIYYPYQRFCDCRKGLETLWSLPINYFKGLLNPSLGTNYIPWVERTSHETMQEGLGEDITQAGNRLQLLHVHSCAQCVVVPIQFQQRSGAEAANTIFRENKCNKQKCLLNVFPMSAHMSVFT